MEFDTANFLENLFGGAAPAAVPGESADGPQAAPAPTAGDGPGAINADDGGADGAAPVPEAEVLLEWIEPDEDAAPRPCPTCGRSDLWETIAGTWRCQHCDAAAWQRSRSLLERAGRLRERSLRQRLTDEERPVRCPRPVAASALPAAS